MKVTGPGSGTPPGATDEAAGAAGSGVPGADDAGGKLTGPDRAGAPDKGEGAGLTAAGKAFADRLSGPAAPGAVQAATAAGGELSADGAALKAGTMTADAALDRAIGRILDKQIGPEAPPALRAQIEAALRDAVASDPLLSDKIKVLSTSE